MIERRIQSATRALEEEMKVSQDDGANLETYSLTEMNEPLNYEHVLRRDSLARLETDIGSIQKGRHQSPVRARESMVNRKVSFNTITVREYGMILGEHPWCSFGPPVQMDWPYNELPTLDIDVYEALARRSGRRTPQDFVLPYYKRKHLLLRAGYSKQELMEATRHANKTKRLRAATRSLLFFSKLEEALQSAKRKVQRLVSNTHGKKMDVETNYLSRWAQNIPIAHAALH
jgi:hypothetical protein